jgi:ketosteroid isomerase-like protein
MSEQENLQIVHRIYDAFSTGDLTAILNQMDDKVDWLFFGSPKIPWAGPRRGRSGVEQFFKAAAAAFEVEAFQADEFLVAGDTIVVLGHERMKMRATGSLVEANWAHIWRLQQGRVVRFREYSDTAAWEAAFEAARAH